MAIVRVTRKQIEDARKALETALRKDKEFRIQDEQRSRIVRGAVDPRTQEVERRP